MPTIIPSGSGSGGPVTIADITDAGAEGAALLATTTAALARTKLGATGAGAAMFTAADAAAQLALLPISSGAGLGANTYTAAQSVVINNGAYGSIARGLALVHTTYDGLNGQPGIGAGVALWTEIGNGTTQIAGAVDAVATNTTSGSQIGELVLSAAAYNAGVSGSNLVEVLRLHPARATFARPLRLARYAVSALPTGAEGDVAFATDGRKVGEGAGLGTGVPVYFSAAAWRVYATDAAVSA